MRGKDGCRGFTLLELMVALAVSGMVLLTAGAVVVGLLGAEDQVSAAARSNDEKANAEHLLRLLVGRMDLSDPRAAFSGGEREVAFPTWCDAPEGWLEPCTVQLTVETSREGMSLGARVSGGTTLVLLHGSDIALRYLATAERGGTWFTRWGSGVTVPLAIGFVIDVDTLMVRVGKRG